MDPKVQRKLFAKWQRRGLSPLHVSEIRVSVSAVVDGDVVATQEGMLTVTPGLPLTVFGTGLANVVSNSLENLQRNVTTLDKEYIEKLGD